MADVKEAVAKEKSRHENAQARIAKEIQELESSQTAAYEQVTAVAMEMKGQGGLFGQATASYAEPLAWKWIWAWTREVEPDRTAPYQMRTWLRSFAVLLVWCRCERPIVWHPLPHLPVAMEDIQL